MAFFNDPNEERTYGEKHAFDLFHGTEASQKRNEDDHNAGRDKNVGSTHIQIGAKQLFHIGVVYTCPNTNCHHHDTANL